MRQGDALTKSGSRFFEDLREAEIVRNGKRMKWDENTKSFVEI